MHEIISNKTRSSISRRCCAFVDSTLVQQLWKIVLSESELVDASSSCVQSKAIQVRSMSEALSVLRLAGGAQGVAHSDRLRSVFQVVRLVRVSVLLLLALLHVEVLDQSRLGKLGVPRQRSTLGSRADLVQGGVQIDIVEVERVLGGACVRIGIREHGRRVVRDLEVQVQLDAVAVLGDRDRYS